MLAFKLNPQAALDAPRVCVCESMPTFFMENANPRFQVQSNADGNFIFVEDGIADETIKSLKKMGHEGVTLTKGHIRAVFGRGQVIQVHNTEAGRVYSAGSDMRGDGHAVPLL